MTSKIDSKVLSNFVTTPIHYFPPTMLKHAFMCPRIATAHIRSSLINSSLLDAISPTQGRLNTFSFSRRNEERSPVWQEIFGFWIQLGGIANMGNRDERPEADTHPER
jgi:hypothetical protein